MSARWTARSARSAGRRCAPISRRRDRFPTAIRRSALLPKIAQIATARLSDSMHEIRRDSQGHRHMLSRDFAFPARGKSSPSRFFFMRPAARRCSPEARARWTFVIQQREQADQAAGAEAGPGAPRPQAGARFRARPRRRARRARSAERRSRRRFSSTCWATASAVYAADGLTQAFADKPEIAVIGRAHDSSGLVRDDFYDWFKDRPRSRRGQGQA